MCENILKYQPSGAVGTLSPPATLHRLQNANCPPGGPIMANVVRKGVYCRLLGDKDRVWKVVYTKVVWRFEQLLRPSCMRNIDKLQNPKIPNGHQGAQNG